MMFGEGLNLKEQFLGTLRVVKALYPFNFIFWFLTLSALWNIFPSRMILGFRASLHGDRDLDGVIVVVIKKFTAKEIAHPGLPDSSPRAVTSEGNPEDRRAEVRAFGSSRIGPLRPIPCSGSR